MTVCLEILVGCLGVTTLLLICYWLTTDEQLRIALHDNSDLEAKLKAERKRCSDLLVEHNKALESRAVWKDWSMRLSAAIRTHRAATWPSRTIKHDIELYEVLNDKIETQVFMPDSLATYWQGCSSYWESVQRLK